MKTPGSFEGDLTTLSTEEMISLRVRLEKEFKARGVKFSVGEIGETVAIDFFNNTPGLSNLQRAPTGTKNVDALSRNGERYSIKTIKDGSKTGTVYPDPTDKQKQLFEHLLLVQLNEAYELEMLYQFSWLEFTKVRQWDKTMNAWYVPKTQKALKEGEKIYGK
ncbi:MAG TPA: hypothetical protein VK462_07510 [Nitrososphaeraceae archaeon]|nr:hypothetical protein [Nitrososphaeraceae archaeon]